MIEEKIEDQHHYLYYKFRDLGMKDEKRLRLFDLAACPVCLDPKTEGEICQECQRGRSFTKVASLSIYKPKDRYYASNISEIVTKMKPQKPDRPYQNPWTHKKKEVEGKILAHLLAWFVKEKSSAIGLNNISHIVPIPSKYEHNQVNYFGYPLKKLLDVKYQDFLKRDSYNNFGHSYPSLISRRPLEDQDVMLLDDIYTNGSTKETCARLLKQIGAKEIFVLVLGRTIPPEYWKAKNKG